MVTRPGTKSLNTVYQCLQRSLAFEYRLLYGMFFCCIRLHFSEKQYRDNNKVKSNYCAGGFSVSLLDLARQSTKALVVQGSGNVTA